MSTSLIRVALLSSDRRFLAEAGSYLAARRGIHVVYALADGRHGLQSIRRERPDVVLLGLVLQRMDGFSVLRELKRMASPPVAIICSELHDERTVRIAGRHGAAYFLCQPIEMSCLYGAIIDLFQFSHAPTGADVPLETGDPFSAASIRQNLEGMGLSLRYRGCEYLAEAIRLVLEVPSRLGNLTRNVYAEIAVQSRTSVSRVERNMRTAILSAHESGRLPGSPEACPSNREFIQYMADRLRTELAPRDAR